MSDMFSNERIKQTVESLSIRGEQINAILALGRSDQTEMERLELTHEVSVIQQTLKAIRESFGITPAGAEGNRGKLLQARHDAAEAVFSSFNFGGEVSGQSNWQDVEGDTWHRVYSVGDKRASFTIIFYPATDAITRYAAHHPDGTRLGVGRDGGCQVLFHGEQPVKVESFEEAYKAKWDALAKGQAASAVDVTGRVITEHSVVRRAQEEFCMLLGQLREQDKLFHLDDNPEDIVNTVTGEPIFSSDEADRIDNAITRIRAVLGEQLLWEVAAPYLEMGEFAEPELEAQTSSAPSSGMRLG